MAQTMTAPATSRSFVALVAVSSMRLSCTPRAQMGRARSRDLMASEPFALFVVSMRRVVPTRQLEGQSPGRGSLEPSGVGGGEAFGGEVLHGGVPSRLGYALLDEVEQVVKVGDAE